MKILGTAKVGSNFTSSFKKRVYSETYLYSVKFLDSETFLYSKTFLYYRILYLFLWLY